MCVDYRRRIAETVGKNMRIVREYHGKSQADIAKILEKTDTAVNANENGRHAFTLSDLEKICRKFSVNPSQLMGYEPLPGKYKK